MIKTFIPILSLIAAVGLYFVYIDPSLANIEILKEQESEFDEALDKVRQLEEIKERLSTQLLSFDKEELEALDKFLPKAVDSVHLVFDVNSIAERYDTQIASVAVDESRAVRNSSGYTTLENPYQTILFKFSIGMDYKNFLAFIKDLEQSLRLMDISSIHFRKSVV